MRRWIVVLAFAILPSSNSSAQPTAVNVQLELVTYKQLGNEIRSLRGSVVLVDFWADYCQPCKQKFPHVLALHRKYASRGLSVVSVSVDDVADPEVRERVKAFLHSQRATCRNLLLAEKSNVWVPKLQLNQIPGMFLFDREGRLINRWIGGEVDLTAIEARINELLAAEPKPGD